MSTEIDRLKEEEKENLVVLASEDSSLNERAKNGQPVQRARRAKAGGDGSMVAGIALVVLGGVFLLANLTGLTINNWWALFILFPAFANFQQAWRSFHRHGRLSASARGAITGGLILTLVASAFLFDFISWAIIWPSLLIILGISALMGAWLR